MWLRRRWSAWRGGWFWGTLAYQFQKKHQDRPLTHPLLPTPPSALPQEVERAPPALQPPLAALARLYAVSRLQRAAAFYLAAGAANRADVAALRAAAADLYGQLTAGGPRCAAVALCDGFGVPDHLLQAPIAFDWRKV